MLTRTAASSNNNYAYALPLTGTTTYAPDGFNQYDSVGGLSFAYDGRGNLTSDGARNFSYDLLNQLTSVSGSASMTLTYDPLGRLRQTVAGGATTQFLYDGEALVAEYDGANTVLRRYVHGPNVDEPLLWYEGSGTASPRYLASDERGSIIASTSSTTPTAYAYGPYGEPANDNWTGARFRYTGQIALLEARLYHYKARAYDPALGRFLQTDPIGFAGGDMNIYAYVANDPVNWGDPWGLQIGCSIQPVIHTASITVFDDRDGSIVSKGSFEYTRDSWICSGGGSLYPSQEAMFQQWYTNQIAVPLLGEAAWELAKLSPTIGTANSVIQCAIDVSNCTAEEVLMAVALRRLGCGCFEEGTLVATPEGLRPIEEIAIGDEVLAWDEATGETSAQRVIDLIRPEPKLIWRLEVRDADGEIEIFHVTDDHPWFIEGEGWVETQHLQAGQRIETADDRGLTILDIGATDRVERTYNLTVENLHTFLVGEDGAVVHNSYCANLLRLGYNANKLNHIFGPARHNLGAVVQRFGTRGQTMTAIHQAAQRFAGQTGVVTGVVNVGGFNVTVRGTTVNGVFRVGTAWR